MKNLINKSAANLFYLTAVFVIAAEILMISGRATGGVIQMPSFFVMAIAGLTYFATTSWSKSGGDLATAEGNK